MKTSFVAARHAIWILGLRYLVVCALIGQVLAAPTAAAKFEQPDKGLEVYRWQDTCNVFVIRSGDSGLLIDLGDGSVLEHLPELGIRNLEWVLLTHHHREQCGGAEWLDRAHTRVAAPLAERALLENPVSFRNMKPSLGDTFSVYGASYVRPPPTPIRVDHTFNQMDVFSWKGFEFHCVETKGNSPGAMSYLLRRPGGWVAFSGDVMLDGARFHNWFDSEWDYGFASGIYALHQSASLLAAYEPDWLFPSHGAPIREPGQQLERFRDKLHHLEELLIRGYEQRTFQASDVDRFSRPTAIPGLWQVSPHLFKIKGPGYFPNFNILLADSGRALVIDCGLLDRASLERALTGMKTEFGLKSIDALVVTHMHGDHFQEAEYLRKQWGAEIWVLDRMVKVMETPENFDYSAMIESYGGLERVKVGRAFHPGEEFDWEGFRLTVDWMPGQTEFALCLNGKIDGRLVAFTGDNLFGNTKDPRQTGHEAVVARNSAIFEEGYIYAGEYLTRLAPDLLVGGHGFVMPAPGAFIERFSKWSYQMRDTFRELCGEQDYQYTFDPYWVRADPYRNTLSSNTPATLNVEIRNFRSRVQQHTVRFHAKGLRFEPPVLEGNLAAGARQSFPVRVSAEPAASPGLRIVGMDTTLDGHRYGEWFDFLVQVQP